MHAQKYAARNITRRVTILCHFADFTRTDGATDRVSASSLLDELIAGKVGARWIAGTRYWNLESRPKLRRDICRIIRQTVRLAISWRDTVVLYKCSGPRSRGKMTLATSPCIEPIAFEAAAHLDRTL